MQAKFKTAIEKHYNIKIKRSVIGPRQFVAETYILDDSSGKQYFCKLINKPLFIPGIIQSLPVVEEMHVQGIDFIGYPVRGADGLYLFVDDTLIVLFNYISALQSFDYDMYELGKFLAQIHEITPKIKSVVKAQIEKFEFPNQKLFEKRFEDILNSKSTDPVMLELKKLLCVYEQEILGYKKKFLCIAECCREKTPDFVITHGDVATNILVKSPSDIYIIDWDELRIAPAERDLWMQDGYPDFIKGYRSIRSDFVMNQDMRSFFILQYYFERMMHYFSEIMDDSVDSDARLELVKKLAKEEMAGWILPKMKELKH